MIRLNKRAESIIQKNIPENIPINLILARGIAEYIKCNSCPAHDLCDPYEVHGRVSMNTCIDKLYQYIEEGEK